MKADRVRQYLSSSHWGRPLSAATRAGSSKPRALPPFPGVGAGIAGPHPLVSVAKGPSAPSFGAAGVHDKTVGREGVGAAESRCPSSAAHLSATKAGVPPAGQWGKLHASWKLHMDVEHPRACAIVPVWPKTSCGMTLLRGSTSFCLLLLPSASFCFWAT